VDNGYPWGSRHDLPGPLALWLIGLGIEMVWNLPRRPQDNGLVERGQQTTQRWGEPWSCRDPAQLQTHLDAAVVVQRRHYPALRGRSREAVYPQLLTNPRRYDPDQEARQWDLARVGAYLSQGTWARRVDGAGTLSLYNRSYYLGRPYAGQVVQVRFDATLWEWAVQDAAGHPLRRWPATQLTRERICALDVAGHRPSPPPSEGA
jgi:hypothetical protein